MNIDRGGKLCVRTSKNQNKQDKDHELHNVTFVGEAEECCKVKMLINPFNPKSLRVSHFSNSIF